MIGVILAAGDGKRLKNSSNEDCCKPLIRIEEKMLIEYALDNLVELNISDAYIVVGKELEQIRAAVGDRYRSIRVNYVLQPEQNGLMNAFVQALNVMKCNETVVLQLSDEIFVDMKTEMVKKSIDAGEYDFYCGVTPESDPQKIKNNFSVDADEDFVIRKCTEKPEIVINNIKGTGFCVFNAEVLEMLKNNYDYDANMPYDLCDYINWLIHEGKKGIALCFAEKEFNINTFADLSEAQNYLKTVK